MGSGEAGGEGVGGWVVLEFRGGGLHNVELLQRSSADVSLGLWLSALLSAASQVVDVSYRGGSCWLHWCLRLKTNWRAIA